MLNFTKNLLEKIKEKTAAIRITVSREVARFSKTREILTPQDTETPRDIIGTEKLAEHCPYCTSNKFVKRGTRKKKLEIVQLYLCRDCDKLSPPSLSKASTFR